MTGSDLQSGGRCSFRLTDVFCPDVREVLHEVTADLEVTGEVQFLSNHGGEAGCFAIVQVEGILSPLIVPADRLRIGRGGISTRVDESRAFRRVERR